MEGDRTTDKVTLRDFQVSEKILSKAQKLLRKNHITTKMPSAGAFRAKLGSRSARIPASIPGRFGRGKLLFFSRRMW
jgi:hypothetical protein